MADLTKRRVWVVDEESIIASTLATILGMDGYLATGFAGTKAASDAAESHAPDILVADISLHDPKGLELACRVIALNPACRILLLSAQAGTSETLWQMVKSQKGGLELLPKPIHPEALLTAVHRLHEPQVTA